MICLHGQKSWVFTWIFKNLENIGCTNMQVYSTEFFNHKIFWKRCNKNHELVDFWIHFMIHTLKRKQKIEKKDTMQKRPKPNENDSNFRDWHLYNNTPLIVQNNKLWNGPGFPYHYRRNITLWFLINYEGAFLFHETFFLTFTGLSWIHLVS